MREFAAFVCLYHCKLHIFEFWSVGWRKKNSLIVSLCANYHGHFWTFSDILDYTCAKMIGCLTD